MVKITKSIAFILIFSCLVGVAYAGTAGEETGEGALFENSLIPVPGNDTSVAYPTEGLYSGNQAGVKSSIDDLIEENSESSITVGSATVNAGETVEIPVSVASLTGAEGIGFMVFFDPQYVEVVSVQATPITTTNASLTYNVTDFHGHQGSLHVAMTHDSLDVGVVPVSLATITFKAKTGIYGESELFLENAEWSHEFIDVPFNFTYFGSLTINSPNLPDLTGYLSPAPPEFIKKYENGTIFMDPTFVIRNVGKIGLNQDFVVQVSFVGKTADYTIQNPIAVDSNFTIYTDVTIVPTSSDTEVIEESGTDYVKLWITAGGDISPGLKTISININPEGDKRVEEIRYDNNYIETQATVTYPDLLPVLKTELVTGLSSSNTTIDRNVIPGTHRVTYGVENEGNVYAVPTYLRVERDGVNTFYDIPALQPGENWTQSEMITLDKTKNAKTYTVEVNSAGSARQDPTEKILHPDQGQQSKTITLAYASFRPVTVVFPQVTGEIGQIKDVPVELSNISAEAPVRSFTIPVTYDPTVCTYVNAATDSGVTVTNTGYGRLLVKGSGVTYGTDTTPATLRFKAQQSEAGRTSVISSTKAASVQTTGGAYLELEITPGAFVQERKTNARVSMWAPTSGPVGSNVSVSVSILNTKSTPVNVSADITADGVLLWQKPEIVLGAYQSRYYTVDTWMPGTAGTKVLTATITGDDDSAGNIATRNVRIDPYLLDITNQNKNYWEQYYGFNQSVAVDNYVQLGTYYSSNMPGMINGTLSMWYSDGTPVDLTQNSPFQMYYYYPAESSIYGYNSDWNSAIWYSITAKEIGTFNYSIELEAKGKNAFVNGTLTVREQNVDIKVLESACIADGKTGGEIEFDIFNRVPFEGRQVKITTSAGGEGRTLAGLEYLVGYPHGCPEQVMSPAFAALRVKQYYESRGKLTDAMNTSFQNVMLRAYNMMKAPDGYNAQKIWDGYPVDSPDYGAWAWGRTSAPSFFYTLYPNYVFSELRHDIDKDPGYWGIDLTNTTEIDLNASTAWMINKQKEDGGWNEWGYINNRYEWTGFASEKFVGEFTFLTPEVQGLVNKSVNKSFVFLESGNYDNQPTKAVAYGVFGLDAIKKHYKENATLGSRADAKMQVLQTRLLDLREGDAVSGYYWTDGWYTDSEATANAILALNKTGLPVENETITGGIRYLVATYDTNGRWGNTRATAAVINTLTELQIPATVDFTAYVGIQLADGTVIRAPEQFTFNENTVRNDFTLTTDQVNALYGNAVGNRTAKIMITDKSDAGTANVSKLVVAVQSFQKVPKSLAIATIPEKFIDPIATDFFLDVTVPEVPAPGLKVGDEVDVVFTARNDGPGAINRTTMILEVPIGAAVNFTGGDNAADSAYYLSNPLNPASEKVYLTHMVDRTAGKLYVYPGSDDESKPSLVADDVKNFYVPLTFDTAGTQTVEARLYPMYNDEWMALGDVSRYVKGNGTMVLTVVNETGAAVHADFYIDDVSVATNINTTRQERLEGDHQVAIFTGNPARWINTTLTVTPGDVVEYSTTVVSDTGLPHIAMVSGAAGDARMMPPEVEETISNTSTNHWNAEVRAEQTFNSSISSSGGIATISVDVPTIRRTIGKAFVNDTVSFSYRNVSGWQGPFNAQSYISGDSLVIPGIDTGAVDQVLFNFAGRPLGDANGDGAVTILDARDIAWYTVGSGSFTFNDEFYADVQNTGAITILDARDIAWYTVGGRDRYFQ